MSLLAEQRSAASPRVIEPGSSGWTAADLDDPMHQATWDREHVELVNGIIVKMPPALYGGPGAGGNLLHVLMQNVEFQAGRILPEFDFLIAEDTVLRPDLVWMSPDDLKRHKVQAAHQDRRLARSRLAVPPTLVIELISEGHERHDRVLKFGRYAAFGVPNYWIVDGFARRFDCYRLVNNAYESDATGTVQGIITPTLFAPLEIPMTDIWVD